MPVIIIRGIPRGGAQAPLLISWGIFWLAQMPLLTNLLVNTLDTLRWLTFWWTKQCSLRAQCSLWSVAWHVLNTKLSIKEQTHLKFSQGRPVGPLCGGGGCHAPFVTLSVLISNALVVVSGYVPPVICSTVCSQCQWSKLSVTTRPLPQYLCRTNGLPWYSYGYIACRQMH